MAVNSAQVVGPGPVAVSDHMPRPLGESRPKFKPKQSRYVTDPFRNDDLARVEQMTHSAIQRAFDRAARGAPGQVKIEKINVKYVAERGDMANGVTLPAAVEVDMKVSMSFCANSN